MKKDKRERLESKGWRVGDADDFLGPTKLDKWEKPLFWVGLGLAVVGFGSFIYWAVWIAVAMTKGAQGQ